MAHKLWTVRRRRAVERFVAEARQRLRLADWDVRLDFDTDAPEGTVAAITHSTYQRRATIVFNAAVFLSESAADQRQTLVHEMLHCHLFDLHDSAALVVDQLPKSKQVLARTMVNDRVEWATDALADAFVALTADLPVPATVAPLRVREELTDASPNEATVLPLAAKQPTHIR